MVIVFTSSAVDRDVCSETLHQCYFYGKPWCVQMFCSVYLVYTRDFIAQSGLPLLSNERDNWTSDFSFRELTGRSGRQQREVGRLLGEVNCD